MGQENLHGTVYPPVRYKWKELAGAGEKKDPVCDAGSLYKHHEKPNALSLIHDTHVSESIRSDTVYSPSFDFVYIGCQTDIFTW